MRVVLAAPNRDLRLALQMFLAEEPGVFLVGVATDASGARALLASARPDLLLLTSDLGEGSAMAFAREARAAGWAPQIILLCRDEDERAEAWATGAVACVSSWDPPERLALAVAAARAATRRGAEAPATNPGAAP
jgi:DNA-binding NarL/FixJ family response regulator